MARNDASAWGAELRAAYLYFWMGGVGADCDALEQKRPRADALGYHM